MNIPNINLLYLLFAYYNLQMVGTIWVITKEWRCKEYVSVEVALSVTGNELRFSANGSGSDPVRVSKYDHCFPEITVLRTPVNVCINTTFSCIHNLSYFKLVTIILHIQNRRKSNYYLSFDLYNKMLHCNTRVYFNSRMLLQYISNTILVSVMKNGIQPTYSLQYSLIKIISFELHYFNIIIVCSNISFSNICNIASNYVTVSSRI